MYLESPDSDNHVSRAELVVWVVLDVIHAHFLGRYGFCRPGTNQNVLIGDNTDGSFRVMSIMQWSKS